MRLSVRLNLSLVAGVAVVSLAIALYQTQNEAAGLKRDLERQTLLAAENLDRTAAPLVATEASSRLQTLIDRFQVSQRLAGVAVFGAEGQPLATTPALADQIGRDALPIARPKWSGGGFGEFFRGRGKLFYAYELPVRAGDSIVGALTIFSDAGYIESREASLWKNALTGLLVQTVLIVSVTMLILQWSLRRPLARLTAWLSDVRRGRAGSTPILPPEDTFEPLQREVARLATSLNAARAAAEQEARLRDAGESLWTADRLRIAMQSKLADSRLFAISNREPYEHIRRNGAVEWSVPASGLVTALEPVLRACDGTWIAQGTGDADRESVDADDRIRRAAGSSAIHSAPRVADAGGRRRLLLRLRQRRPVAALPHRPHAPHLPRRRLGAVSQGEPALRGRVAGRGRRRTEPRGAGAGLPLRAGCRA